MATKTITLSEDSYEILKSWKKDSESFSETIRRIGGKKKLTSFIGILSKETADKMQQEIKDSRKQHAKDREKRLKRLGI